MMMTGLLHHGAVVGTRRRPLVWEVLFTVIVVALPAGPAYAEDSPATTDQRTGGLEEIVVTARRVEESKQTTPVSISAFSAADLVANGISNTSDLMKLTPGVILNGSGDVDNTTFTIRGQGKAIIGPGLPSVITYLNEVPLQSYGSSPPVFDINNIQILKGPQGTSFGRNTTGGAVLVYTTQPNYKFGGYAQTQLGDYGDAEFQGAINLPIIDQKLAVRLATDIERRDGYTNNVATGRNLDDKHSNALRLSVLMQPTDALKNVIVIDYVKYAINGIGEFPIEYRGPDSQFPGLAAVIAAQAALGNRTVATTDFNPHLWDTFWGASNTTSADFGILTAKNIFGYRNTNTDQAVDVTGLPLAPLPTFLGPLGAGTPGIYTDSTGVRRDEQFSDELQFAGTALDRNLTWIFGAFYLKDRPSGPDYIIADIFRPVPPSATAIFIDKKFLGGTSPSGYLGDNLYTDESRSGFLTLTYDLAQLSPALQGLKLDGGYRYTWDRHSVCANNRPIDFLTGEPMEVPFQSLGECQANSQSFNASSKSSAPTYTAGLDYTVNDDLFLYFTTRTGYRAGGLNTPAMASSLAAYQTYEPQKVKDYEIGLHDQWQAGGWKGRFNFDIFHDKYTNLQFTAAGILAGDTVGGVVITPANDPTNTNLTLNAGSATFDGAELDGSVSPVRGLTFAFGAAYLNAKYDTLTVPDILTRYFSAANFVGAPRWSYQAAVQYVLPVHPGSGDDIAVKADFYHIDPEYQNFALVRGYDLTGLSVAWRNVYGQPLDLTFAVDNVFNARYVQNVVLSTPGLGVFAGNYGPPRMFTARLRYTFGD
jgi:iron complex outermembrane receptor protein